MYYLWPAGALMDEASSRFVDQIVLEKIVNEKLARVHHYPTVSLSALDSDIFSDFSTIERIADVRQGKHRNYLEIKSPLEDGYRENQFAPVITYNARDPHATILFMHGLFEDNRDIYKFLINGLNKSGYSVNLMTLPFHYERMPEGSLFSGEYFWSADIIRTRRAFKQAVYEMYQFYNWLKLNLDHPVYIAGFSMGACIALMLASIYHEFDGLFAINPAVSLTSNVWDSPLCKTIKEDYLTAGYSFEEIKGIYSRFEPVSVTLAQMEIRKISIAYALYDVVTEKHLYESLVKKWNLKNVIQYKAGHLNTLRVPRLADDMIHFFGSLVQVNH